MERIQKKGNRLTPGQRKGAAKEETCRDRERRKRNNRKAESGRRGREGRSREGWRGS